VAHRRVERAALLPRQYTRPLHRRSRRLCRPRKAGEPMRTRGSAPCQTGMPRPLCRRIVDTINPDVINEMTGTRTAASPPCGLSHCKTTTYISRARPSVPDNKTCFTDSKLQITDSTLQIGESTLRIGDPTLQIAGSTVQIVDRAFLRGLSDRRSRLPTSWIGDLTDPRPLSEVNIDESKCEIDDFKLRIGDLKCVRTADECATTALVHDLQFTRVRGPADE
jgi:hypothetical protein